MRPRHGEHPSSSALSHTRQVAPTRAADPYDCALLVPPQLRANDGCVSPNSSLLCAHEESPPGLRPRRRILTFAFGITVAIAIAPHALAGATVVFPGPYADNGYHVYYISGGLRAAEKKGFRAAMTKAVDADTDMRTAETSTRDGSTDVWAFDTTVTSGTLGGAYAWATCTKRVKTLGVNTNRCDTWTIAYNHKYTHSNQKALGCHEIGHTIGFDHVTGSRNSKLSAGNRSCMNDSPDHPDYSGDEIAAINKRW